MPKKRELSDFDENMNIIHKEKDANDEKKEGEELMSKVMKMRSNFKAAIAKKC